MVPKIGREERKRDTMLDVEDSKEILDHLTNYEFASRDHGLMALLWETGIRIGSANSIDLQNVHLHEKYIDLVHRPDTGTTMEYGKTGERPIAITSGLAEVLGESVENRRIDVGGDYGREPSITSQKGRYSRNSIRMSVYRITAPCFRDKPCPDCNQGIEKRCPEAVSPHATRRGSITHFLTSDIPEEIVSDR